MIWFAAIRDHASGNEKMASLVPGLKVCGNDSRIGALNHSVKHNQELKVLHCLHHLTDGVYIYLS